jgi:hypothetical protein
MAQTRADPECGDLETEAPLQFVMMGMVKIIKGSTAVDHMKVTLYDKLVSGACATHLSFSSTMAFSIIDDRDPKITYTGTWNLGGTANEHNGTVSSSIKVGNHFSVPFTGVYSRRFCSLF